MYNFFANQYRRSKWLHPLTEIALTAFILGALGMLSLGLILAWLFGYASTAHLCGGLYLFCATVMFHMTEFIVAAQFRPRDATPRSFMVFHSYAFVIANSMAWLEFIICGVWLDLPYRPPLNATVALIGCAACVAFYSIRIAAMVQCGSNFSFLVESAKRKEHCLVTHGVYSIWRHPSYVGWFWYSLATQVIVCNPFCFVGFAVTLWYFFRQRIHDEEEILSGDEFFGQEYVKYAKTTRMGIPFI